MRGKTGGKTEAVPFFKTFLRFIPSVLMAACQQLFDFWKISRGKASQLSASPESGIAVNDSQKTAVSKSVVELELCSELMPEWVEKGERIAIAIERLPEPCTQGEPLAYFHTKTGEIPAILKDGKRIVFNFDPQQVVDYLLYERYCTKRRPVYAYLPFHYHKIPFRLFLSRMLSLTHRWRLRSKHFPAWPIEKSVDALRFAFMRCAELAYGAKADYDFWNGKKYAFCTTHDVDTAKGFGNIGKFAELEHELGISATYNLLTNYYKLDLGAVSRIAKSHEIGWHGYNHDNKLPFLSREKIRARFSANTDFFKRFSVRGMRSPCLLTSDALDSIASEFLQYDSSVPDTAVFISGTNDFTGCCSVFPYAKSSVVELPLTLPMDADLQYLGFNPKQILDAWLSKLEWVKRVRGIAVLNTHTDQHYSGNDEMLGIYERFLRHVSKDSSALTATCAEIAEHWRASGRSGN